MTMLSSGNHGILRETIPPYGRKEAEHFLLDQIA
jgi:hypothetical protein